MIQAALTEPGVLEKFLSPPVSSLVRKCFAKQYNLGLLFDNQVTSEESLPSLLEEMNDMMSEAISDGSKWVLKPQREGGGNNLYGKELSTFLATHRQDPVLAGDILLLFTSQS